MPITSSAKKALKRSRKNKVKNDTFRDALKSAVRTLKQKIKKGQKVVAADLQNVYRVIDKALKVNIIHKNTAARKKSRLTRMVNKYTNKA